MKIWAILLLNQNEFLLIGVVDFFSVVGSIATAGAFIALFFKDKDKQKQINKLSKISNDLAEQTTTLVNQYNLDKTRLKLSVAPRFVELRGGSNPSTKIITLDLYNKGETAIITNIETSTTAAKIGSIKLPMDVDKDCRKNFKIIVPPGANVNKFEHQGVVHYQDVLKNKFKVHFEGVGGSGKYSEVIECN